MVKCCSAYGLPDNRLLRKINPCVQMSIGKRDYELDAAKVGKNPSFDKEFPAISLNECSIATFKVFDRTRKGDILLCAGAVDLLDLIAKRTNKVKMIHAAGQGVAFLEIMVCCKNSEEGVCQEANDFPADSISKKKSWRQMMKFQSFKTISSDSLGSSKSSPQDRVSRVSSELIMKL
jgi:hypothetical protein